MIATDALLYRILSRLLLYGVVLSLGLMVLGYTMLAARHAAARDAWLPLPDVIPRAVSGDPRGILDLGVLVLLATPTLRVVATIGLFAAERDRRYALIAILVLALLALSITVALLRG